MATTGAPAANISEQYVREAPDIEAYKLGLMQSAQALQMPNLPDYQVAGMTDQQKAAIQAGQSGIGAYLPYLQGAGNNITSAAGTLGEAADVLRGADTRGQFAAAQQAYNNAAGAASGIGALSNVAGSGMGLIGAGSKDIDTAQQMAANNANANLGQSQDFLTGSAYQALNASQQPGFGQGIGSMAAGALQGAAASQLGAAPTAEAAGNVFAPQQNTVSMNAAQTGYNPQLQTFQMGPAQQVGAQNVTANNIQAAQMGPAQEVQTKSFAQPGAASTMMSPYMDAVVKAQQREAMRNAGIMGLQRNAAATKSGAFGGSRQAIENAEANRNLSTQLGDIESTGLQQAYQQAQNQFNTEQQANLTAQQANQQAGLTVGGQNLNAQQQANVQNAANQLQASGMTAQQAMQAALANQQAGLTVGQQNLASQQSTQQLGTQTGLQTSLANLSSEQQANVQNQAAQLQTQGMNAQQAMQAALANQGVTQQTNLANQAMQGQYGLQGAQLGMQAAGLTQNVGQAQINAANSQGALGMQAAQQAANVGQTLGSQQIQNAQLGQSAANTIGQLGTSQAGLAGQYANIAGQQANILGAQAAADQSIGQGIGSLATQQFGIGQNMAQGLGSLGTQLGNMGVQQAALGQTAQQLANNDVNSLYSLGAVQQKQNQSVLDAQRATEMQNAMQPYQQIAFQSDIYKGAPSTQMAVTSQQAAAPSPFQQIAGVGTGILGLAGAAKTTGLI